MKSKGFNHYILTRFNTQLMPDGMLYDDFNKANKWMDSRMEMFYACRESVLSQEGEFTWVISLDNRTPNRYIQNIVCDSRIEIVHCDVRDTFKDVEVDTDWVMTTRLDCDDQLRPGFVKEVQSRFEPMLKVIDVRFDELDWDTKKIYEGETRWAGSMFISLVEPSDRILTVFCRPHGMVASGYPMEGTWDEGWGQKSLIWYEIIEERLAYMVCHGNNIANKITGKYLRDL